MVVEQQKIRSKKNCHGLSRKEAIRTPDPYVPNVVRYQLRYFPFCGCKVTKKSAIPQHKQTFLPKNLHGIKKVPIFALAIRQCREAEIGAIAQLVEQRTENPCVPGSIPGGTTTKTKQLGAILTAFAVLYNTEAWRKKAACFP